MTYNGITAYAGQISGLRKKVFTNRDTGAEETTHYLQFIEQKPDGSLGVQEVKIPDGINPEMFQKGQIVALPVAMAAYHDKVYLRIDRNMMTKPVLEALKSLSEAIGEELSAA